MFLRSSAGMITALCLLVVVTVCSCSEKTFRDINYGTDKGDAFVPEVSETRSDMVTDTAPDGGADPDSATAGDTQAAETTDDADAPDAVGDDAETTLDNG